MKIFTNSLSFFSEATFKAYDKKIVLHFKSLILKYGQKRQTESGEREIFSACRTSGEII